MDKLKMESPNLTEKNIEKIGKLFPNALTEMKDEDGNLKKGINFEVLKQELSGDVIDGEECYDFTWIGKKAAIVEANTTIRKTLRPCLEESKNWETTENMYIEGDNLDVLKLLQESYLNSVKMIYIDPPYNTGNDSFVYSDRFVMDEDEYEEGIEYRDDEGNINFKQNNETNPRFHSDWCKMMYSRLKLAQNLLKDSGVIFISIDDGEVENLKKICNEVFGKGQFRNCILARRRIKSLNSQFAEKGLRSLNVAFEYVLVYAKGDLFLMKALRVKKVNASIKGRWDVFWSNADRPTMRYNVLGFTPKSGQWRYSKEKAIIAIENYQKYINKNANKMSLEEYWVENGCNSQFVRRIPNGTGKNGGVQHWVPPSETALRTSNWSDIEVSQIHKEFNVPFDNPKSADLIKELIKLAGVENDDLILDFFSGSATTGHAVMQLNAEDGGNRKFIMVQLPEPIEEKSEAYKAGYKNISEIGIERIRRAGEKIKQDNKEKKGIENLDIGFRVLKVDSTNMKDVYYAANEYNQQMLSGLESNIKEDRTDLDLLYGVLLDWGLPLSLKHYMEEIDGVTVHTVDQGSLIACFADHVPESVVREIAKRQPLRVVFRDSSFASSPEKINVEEIFKLLAPNTSVRVI